VLVHCAAGKDRTGVVVALALSIAGVQRDAIVADYALTGERIGAILDRLRASVTYAKDVDRLADDAHRPRAQTMASFLAEIDRRYGGVDGWLVRHGFTSVDAGLLRTTLRPT
jgi:protein tyrosine/serine phosphatase